MDQLTEHRNLLGRILNVYVELSNSQPKTGVENVLIVDEQRGHYVWFRLGWENGKRIKYLIVYVRLRDGKFWIEEDLTENGIATDLVREGVPREEIVLAFHDPETRKSTDFAAA